MSIDAAMYSLVILVNGSLCRFRRAHDRPCTEAAVGGGVLYEGVDYMYVHERHHTAAQRSAVGPLEELLLV